MHLSEKEKQLVAKFLKRIPVFRSFSEGNLDHVIEDFRILSVNKGEDIVFRADEGTDLYIVLKGKVKVSLLSMEGGEFILTSLRAGDFFGEMSLIDGKSRSANVVAEEETALGVLKREKFLNTMKEEPVIAFDLLTALVERLRKADDILETLVFLDVHERIVRFLVQGAKSDGEIDERGYYKIKKITHLEIASNIGSSREAVSKALKVLAHKEAVTLKEGFYYISPDVCEPEDEDIE
jgi:CRP-like cAMP-binding protein